MINTEVTHQVNLVDGVFTPSEASDVINSLIKEKVNFHKLHRLSLCEGNVESDTQFDDSRVARLLKERENFKSIYKEALLAGKSVRISGVLNIDIID